MTVKEQQVNELKATFYRFRRSKLPPPTRPKVKPSGIMLLMSLKDLEEETRAPVRVSALARMLHLAPPTISLMLKEVEEAGLIERYADPADKRRVYVRPTAKGKKAQVEAMHCHEAMLTALAEFLGPEDTEALIRILRRGEEFMQIYKEDNNTCGS